MNNWKQILSWSAGMTLGEFIIRTNTHQIGDYINRPRLYCNDGFSMSVQASARHYCYPRRNTDSYATVEIGCPSTKDNALSAYDDDAETTGIYPNVPFRLVEYVIEQHGGIDAQKTFGETN